LENIIYEKRLWNFISLAEWGQYKRQEEP
jgi:hypothetical protein